MRRGKLRLRVMRLARQMSERLGCFRIRISRIRISTLMQKVKKTWKVTREMKRTTSKKVAKRPWPERNNRVICKRSSRT